MMPWTRAELPLAYLTDEDGDYLDGSLIRLLSVRMLGLEWQGVELALTREYYWQRLLVDDTGQVRARCLPYPRPGTGQHVARETHLVRDARFSLVDPDGSVVATTDMLEDSAGRYGPGSLCWSPDGTRFAIGGYRVLYVVGFERARADRYEIARATLPALVFVDNVSVALLDGSTLKKVDADSGTVVSELEDPSFNRNYGMLCSPDRSELVIGGPVLSRVSVAGCERRSTIDLGSTARRPAYARPLGFAPDGAVLLVSSGTHLCCVSWPGGNLLQSLDLGPDGVGGAAISPDGSRLAATGGGKLHIFTRGGRAPSRLEAPRFVCYSLPAARRRAEPFPSTLDELYRRARFEALFDNLGKPSPDDDALVRIYDFDDWPGPESEETGSLDVEMQSFINTSTQALRVTSADLSGSRPLLDRLREQAAAKLALRPGEEDDPYSPPTSCLAHFDVLLETIAAFLVLGWQVPEDLVELFLLYEAGHWPCGYSESIGSASAPVKLLVL